MDNSSFSCGIEQKIIEIHPMLNCNLFCKHCYSESGPSNTTLQLDLKTVENVISDGKDMGYNVVTISGGEPLMYKDLYTVLKYAKDIGFRTSIVTNATLLNPHTISKLENVLDLMAISVDGPPKLHNDIRNSKIAYNEMLQGLKHLENHGSITYGFIHTLTQSSWEYLPWLAEFTLKHGSSFLQVHPLESIGRSDLLMKSKFMNYELLAKSYLLILSLLAKYKGKLHIQYDAFLREQLLEQPEFVYASKFTNSDLNKVRNSDTIKPGDLISVLVVEADGSVFPVSYGMSQEFEICNVKNKSLLFGWHDYINSKKYLQFRKLCRTVFNDYVKNDVNKTAIFNWFELVVKNSYHFTK